MGYQDTPRDHWRVKSHVISKDKRLLQCFWFFWQFHLEAQTSKRWIERKLDWKNVQPNRETNPGPPNCRSVYSVLFGLFALKSCLFTNKYLCLFTGRIKLDIHCPYSLKLKITEMQKFCVLYDSNRAKCQMRSNWVSSIVRNPLDYLSSVNIDRNN